MMARYRHVAARLVITRLLPSYAKFVLCAVAKLVILAHVAIMAHFGYCLSLKVNSWVSDLAGLARDLA
jgi:TRAP-type C4-dicarboxylate transport system permease small subunit